ncbi:MAG: DAK2 domain-containing protein, partial [Tissierellia bacterium]|nr:DAK2 domain-containing protein [Tissierellia bacterium]
MKTEYMSGSLLKKAFIGAANLLEKNKEMINALNVFPVPDGDTGTNMSLTMQSAIRQLDNLKHDDIEDIANTVSNGSLLGARGNSGVILSQLLRGFSNGLKKSKDINTKAVALAFKEGAETAYKAVMKPIEGTILTVARECGEKAIEIAKNGNDLVSFLEELIKHGEVALNKTPEMLPVLKEAGVVDAGGKGLIVLLQGALLSLKGEDDYISNNEDVSQSIEIDFQQLVKTDEDIKFGYCTEFLINNNNNNNSKNFAKDIGNLGDSMMVIDGDGFIKVHIHTNNPGTVLQKALEVGELLDIKIDNMRYQSSNTEDDIIELKKYGFITVSMGE